MIPFASQRGGGQDLATHLSNEYDNDMVEVVGVRGAIARDLHGAFKEWQVQAETLTKCQKYLYSMSINPDPAQSPLTREQYMDYIGRAEKALGLEDQPRAIVFHSKYGREHCHVVWSRIQPEHEKAIQLAFDHYILMDVTRGFARDHGLSLPEGYSKSREAGQKTLHQYHQEQKTGISEDDHKALVTEAWRHSDSARTFVSALAERGYILATGRKDYVLVDLYGGTASLPRMIQDKSVRMKEVREFLAKDFPKESLPTVEEAQALVEKHRKVIEQTTRIDRRTDLIDELKKVQQIRRRTLEHEREALHHTHSSVRLMKQAAHRFERDNLRESFLAKTKALRTERSLNKPTGLAGFLGRVSGVNFLREKLNRQNDARSMAAHLEQKRSLKTKQEEERKMTELRLKLQSREIERRLKALDKVDARELAALERDMLRDERVMGRGQDNAMPSLESIAGLQQMEVTKNTPNLLDAFAKAKRSGRIDAPDLLTEAASRSSPPDPPDLKRGAPSMKKDFERKR